jgi:hypothetical protein
MGDAVKLSVTWPVSTMVGGDDGGVGDGTDVGEITLGAAGGAGASLHAPAKKANTRPNITEVERWTTVIYLAEQLRVPAAGTWSDLTPRRLRTR